MYYAYTFFFEYAMNDMHFNGLMYFFFSDCHFRFLDLYEDYLRSHLTMCHSFCDT